MRDMEFTIREEGKIIGTTDLLQVEKWVNEGYLVLFSCGFHHYILTMKKGEEKKSIKINDKQFIQKVLKFWKKGFNLHLPKYRYGGFKEKEDPTILKKKFEDTLIAVADAIKHTNAQKSIYFRNATPYKQGNIWVVDFPTKENKLKRTIERFKKEGKPYGVTTLYHGSRLRNIPSIVRCGLRKSNSKYGMLGGGIYVGKLNKARGYSDLIIFQVKVVLGRCKELNKVEHIGQSNGDYDSLHAKEGKIGGVFKGFLRNEEWIIRDPCQIEISKLVCKDW